MGRPKGLRKGPDGKWYMPAQEQAMLAEEPKLKIQPPAYKRKGETHASHNSKPSKNGISDVAIPAVVSAVPEPVIERRTRKVSMDWQRNDMAVVDDGAQRKTGLVLGYAGSKVVVQLLDGATRLTLDESHVYSINEVRE